MELIPAVQNYDWGQPAGSSLVYKFAKNVADSELKFAELWMGTHPSGPARIRETGETLASFLAKEDGFQLGEKVVERFGPQVPFLLKVLSVQKALSIQAHPDLGLAAELHAKFPEVYKDGNHKPEMAIALTEFEMMCGFRRMEEIVGFLKEIPELGSLIGAEALQEFEASLDKKSLKKVYTKLMESKEEVVGAKVDEFVARLKTLGAEEQAKLEGSLVLRLSTQFPRDVGIFSVFFLQHFTLKPGQAVFLPANEPHAYVHGDCIECMAASDNVVRAGLTPKFKDVSTLCSMLTYETGKNPIFPAVDLSNGIATLYDPPVPEFAVMKYQASGCFSLKPHSDSCSILICVEGQGKAVSQNSCEKRTLEPGTVLFIPCKSDWSGCQIVPEEGNEIKIYEAFATP